MALAVGGCQLALPASEAPTESAAPAPRPQAALPEPGVTEDGTIARYFARIEAQRRAEGLLRTDVEAPDLPFTASDLVENFVRIALYDEYQMVGGRPVARATPSTLRRWQEPVRMRLEFGASVPPEIRDRDRREVAGLAARLGRLTGHPVALGRGGGNFHVLVLSEAERRAIGPRLRELVPGIDEATVRIVTEMPLETFCLALAFSRGGDDVYTDAVTVIRAEHPDLTRRACYHEELAQAMGLPNDSLRARPSIFNDKAEFALLTPHDELLLRILYDPRLRPGLREAEARPIVTRIVAELMGAES
ncbi:MAG: DUF2927 domain-containing protein [Rhodobacteraceae bacterium]|nr:DUF2927 domain-containing protein [Paracoccaceae bacterium]